MNNDLEQFSEERLKQMVKFCETSIHGLPKHFEASEVAAIARIALAAKQAKPVADDVLRIMQEEWDEWCADTGCFPDDFEWKGGNGTLSFEASRWAARIAARVSSLTTPQPAHTEQGKMPDKALSLSETIGELRKYIDSSGGYNFEDLRSEQVNSPVIPDRSMLRNLVDLVWNEAKESTEVPSTKFADQLIDTVFPADAPKPESE